MAGYNNQNYGNQNQNQQRNYNLVQNWGLRVYAVKQTQKGIMLNCTYTSRKQDGSYTQPMYIRVFCGQNVQLPNINLEKQNITVSGQFKLDDYVDRNNNTVNSYTIFATNIAVRQGRQQNGGQNGGNYRQNGNNGGYQQGGYQNNNGGYNNNNGGYQQGGNYQQNNGGNYNGQQNGGYQQNNGNYQQNNSGPDFGDFESFDGGVTF